jgi:hypothetical protein
MCAESPASGARFVSPREFEQKSPRSFVRHIEMSADDIFNIFNGHLAKLHPFSISHWHIAQIR